MATMIFMNIPVKDLEQSRAFFSALGYTFNEQFSNDKGACMVVSDTIYYMLLTEPFFKSFIDKEIADSSKANECINCLSVDSRAGVDDIITKAKAAGARIPEEPTDYGFMYSQGFEDLDGHLWNYCWMDPNGKPEHQ